MLKPLNTYLSAFALTMIFSNCSISAPLIGFLARIGGEQSGTLIEFAGGCQKEVGVTRSLQDRWKGFVSDRPARVAPWQSPTLFQLQFTMASTNEDPRVQH